MQQQQEIYQQIQQERKKKQSREEKFQQLIKALQENLQEARKLIKTQKKFFNYCKETSKPLQLRLRLLLQESEWQQEIQAPLQLLTEQEKMKFLQLSQGLEEQNELITQENLPQQLIENLYQEQIENKKSITKLKQQHIQKIQKLIGIETEEKKLKKEEEKAPQESWTKQQEEKQETPQEQEIKRFKIVIQKVLLELDPQFLEAQEEKSKQKIEKVKTQQGQQNIKESIEQENKQEQSWK